MGAILRVRQADGTIVEIPAIKGDAYEPIYTDDVTGKKYKFIVSDGEIYLKEIEE